MLDGRTDRVTPIYPPTTSLCWGYNIGSGNGLSPDGNNVHFSLTKFCGIHLKVQSTQITQESSSYYSTPLPLPPPPPPPPPSLTTTTINHHHYPGHDLLWDVVTYTCFQYQLLTRKSTQVICSLYICITVPTNYIKLTFCWVSHQVINCLRQTLHIHLTVAGELKKLCIN